MSGRLKGQVAIVTGGAGGIGAATVRRFVDEGARVVVADVQDVAGKTLVTELGESAVYARCDVSREDEVAAGRGRPRSRPSARLDVFFANAGVMGALGPIAATRTEDADATIAVEPARRAALR